MARKTAETLRGNGLIYVEVIDDEAIGGDSGPWISWCCDILYDADPLLPIAVHVAERTGRLQKQHPRLRIANFRHARPEAAVANYHHAVALANHDMGGSDVDACRREAIRFLFSGGSIVGQGEGRQEGIDALRRQLAFVRRELEARKAWGMAPANEDVLDGDALVLARYGQRLAYLPYGGAVTLAGGTSKVERLWLDPVACEPLGPGDEPEETGDGLRFRSPEGREAILALEGFRDRI